ncbi:hypothetical protein MMC22_001298 [Lobaria immixta]|nr:hypothetical protein [Lobaria immixta]
MVGNSLTAQDWKPVTTRHGAEHYSFALWEHSHDVFPHLICDEYSVAIATDHKELSIIQPAWDISTRGTRTITTDDIKGLFVIFMLPLQWAVLGCIDESMNKASIFVKLPLLESGLRFDECLRSTDTATYTNNGGDQTLKIDSGNEGAVTKEWNVAAKDITTETPSKNPIIESPSDSVPLQESVDDDNAKKTCIVNSRES